MNKTIPTEIDRIKKRISQEEKKYQIALKENKSYSELKGHRIILHELRKQLQNALEKITL